MPAGINPIRKAKVKSLLLQGKTGKEAMLKAGYSKSAACQLKNMPVYNCITEEIKEDLKEIAIDDQYVLKGLKREAESAKNSSDRIAALSWLGKYRAMFTDKQEIANVDKPDNQFSLDRLAGIKKAVQGSN